MSGQDQTTANKPSEPLLCKMGCGFFGNGATGGCCSKCWREHMKKQGVVEVAPQVSLSPAAKESAAPEPMDVEPAVALELAAQPAAASPSTTPIASSTPPTSQTKKKKTSYKNMMASMMKQQNSERDVEKEKEALRKVTGGGAFSKIDKI